MLLPSTLALNPGTYGYGDDKGFPKVIGDEVSCISHLPVHHVTV